LTAAFGTFPVDTATWILGLAIGFEPGVAVTTYRVSQIKTTFV